MTDRLNGLLVVLEHNIREDDAQSIINAIQMIHGVLKVTKKVADPGSYIAEERARHELREKLWTVLK